MELLVLSVLLAFFHFCWCHSPTPRGFTILNNVSSEILTNLTERRVRCDLDRPTGPEYMDCRRAKDQISTNTVFRHFDQNILPDAFISRTCEIWVYIVNGRNRGDISSWADIRMAADEIATGCKDGTKTGGQKDVGEKNRINVRLMKAESSEVAADF